ncbi:hypothetical protein K502DRAFT_285905 [Neoconidiobolus thromboides FSU 785]|nr:hypothetical protein K502DRAFT_285905 [Neoconidiobolus thromboides FSU 785]
MFYSFTEGIRTLDSLTCLDLELWKTYLNSESYWIDLINPTSSELNLIKQVFQLDMNSVEAIYTQNSKESLETLKNYDFLSYQSTTSCVNEKQSIFEMEINSCSIYNIITTRGIITVSNNYLPHRERVLQRLQALKSKNHNSTGWIAYAILDQVIDNLDPLLKACILEAEKLEDLILLPEIDSSKAFTEKTIYQLNVLKQQVFSISKLMSHKLDLCHGLTERVLSKKDFDNGIQLYFGDVEDHITSMMQNCIHLEKILTRSYSNYMDSLTLKYIRDNNSTFDQSMVLTYLGAIFSVFLLTTGIWGMNVKVLGRTDDDNPDENTIYWFVGILIGSLLLAILFGSGLHWYAKRSLK